MGQAAASTLLAIIHNGHGERPPASITVYPNLVVRESTGLPPCTEAASAEHEWDE